MRADPAATALFLSAFLDELTRWGVRDVVISPGSRSTPLTMTAYELSLREPEQLRLYVDVDERGAAFFALGLAKASGRPAVLICTSGTAVANYYPAVMEAESSRVPLMVLTGDRPARLQGLGAPQTCDQLKAFGDHVRLFRQMPQPEAGEAAIAFARQAAREACIFAGGEVGGKPHDIGLAATQAASSQKRTLEAPAPRIAGACAGGPVHVNFPFDEPLKPDFSVAELFCVGRPQGFAADLSDTLGMPLVRPACDLGIERIRQILALLANKRALILAGEGTCATEQDARIALAFARSLDVPLLADPLSGLRTIDDAYIIDNYDTVLGSDQVPSELAPEVVIRFGRYPISKKATLFIATENPFQVVVDSFETRDYLAQTNIYIACSPIDFMVDVLSFSQASSASELCAQAGYAQAWADANERAKRCIEQANCVEAGFEGAFVQRVVELAPQGSCVFAGNSMSIRALDTFYLKSNKCLSILCNRGLNGIDGTVSSALGAAQYFAQTTLIVGDLAMLHDINAFALQRELLLHHGADNASSLVVVLLNNNGGAIFDMLPQKSEESYFERLFLTPQQVNFKAAAATFEVPYCAVETVAALGEAYSQMLGVPGISLIEVKVPLEGLKDRYAPYWRIDTSE